MKIVLEMALQSSAFILLLLVLRPWMKRALSARMRYALWLLPMLRLSVPFSIKSTFSIWNPAQLSRFAPSSSLPSNNITAVLPSLPGTGDFGHAIGSSSPELATQAAPVHNVQWNVLLPQITLWLWLVGAIVMLSWMLVTNYRFYRLTRQSKQMMSFGFPLPVYLMESLASPCLVGVLKPRILLNRASIRSQEMVDMVLLHEMTHFQHRDNLWTTLRTLLLCLWWWNPLVWAACKYSREDCEAACDEAVVSKMTSSERQVYGLSLIELMRQNTGKVLQLSVGTGMRSGKKQMEERITMIKVFKHVKWKTATCFLLCKRKRAD